MLKKKGLMENKAAFGNEAEWLYWELWHHEGRRARMGATHGAPDYAHWHGFFELMQDLYELEGMYKKRIESGKIED